MNSREIHPCERMGLAAILSYTPENTTKNTTKKMASKGAYRRLTKEYFLNFQSRSGVNSQDESEKYLNNYFGIIGYIV